VWPVSLWIVTNIPSWMILLGLIVGVSGGAVVICRVVRKRFPTLAKGTHNDSLQFGYGVIGFVYAFFIGFVVSGMWGQITAADALAGTEGAAGVQLAKDRVAFDPAVSASLGQSLLRYERAAVAEWPEAARGQSLPEATNALALLSQAYRDIKPQNDIQKSVQSASLANLDKLSQARTERIIAGRTETGPPWPLWVVIFLTSALVLGCAITYGVEMPAMHYPMVAIVGAMVAANLFLALLLSHPFAGEISTSTDALRTVIEELTQSPS
jgi:hypothetical protein